ncbi:MAG: GNAT family N-acetyltransferase, partial [Oscillospiraceae bacterium]|nr:GNAT family N-acetyltransferase [Oscillospiraceae bacterium]
YCLESHLKNEGEITVGADRRKKAEELIINRIMTGYLIYDGERAVGWCNAGDKTNYVPVCEKNEFRTEDDEKGRVKILYCIDIAPEYQGKGLAGIMMERFLSDAAKEGFSYAEGYPFTDRDFIWQYHGPVRLYEKFGFKLYRECPDFYIMRKTL